jgi:hypothetical protein
VDNAEQVPLNVHLLLSPQGETIQAHDVAKKQVGTFLIFKVLWYLSTSSSVLFPQATVFGLFLPPSHRNSY